MQLQQPGAPLVRDVREDGDAVDQVEEAVRPVERGRFAVHEGVNPAARGLAQPSDARLVDVATPELCMLGFRQEMAQDAAGTAPEVQHALAWPGPLPG
jgi:hypothetical protein